MENAKDKNVKNKKEDLRESDSYRRQTGKEGPICIIRKFWKKQKTKNQKPKQWHKINMKSHNWRKSWN